MIVSNAFSGHSRGKFSSLRSLADLPFLPNGKTVDSKSSIHKNIPGSVSLEVRFTTLSGLHT